MKKTVTVCIGNAGLFLLVGLAFLFPFSEMDQMESGFSARLTLFPLLLIAYLIVFPVVYLVLARKYKWGKASELTFSDEREKGIVAEATKIAYNILVGGLLLSIAALGGLQFFGNFANISIDSYAMAVTLLTMILIVSTISYCIKWCIEYKK